MTDPERRKLSDEEVKELLGLEPLSLEQQVADLREEVRLLRRLVLLLLESRSPSPAVEYQLTLDEKSAALASAEELRRELQRRQRRGR